MSAYVKPTVQSDRSVLAFLDRHLQQISEDSKAVRNCLRIVLNDAGIVMKMENSNQYSRFITVLQTKWISFLAREMKQKLSSCFYESSGWNFPVTLVADTLDPRKQDAGISTAAAKEKLRATIRKFC